MDIFATGAWRSPTRCETVVGGTFRRVTHGEIYLGGEWRICAMFASALTLTATDAFGSSFSNAGTYAVASATPTGGLAPYTYAWTLLTGDMALTDGTTASPTFFAAVPYNTYKYGTARVVCTDAGGASATADISIALTSEHDTGNQ